MGAFSPISFLVSSVLTVCFIIFAVELWSSGRERQALLRLSPEVRARVFIGALANLKELCPPGARSPALTERCREQATFLAQFPDCDADCRTLVRSNLPQPTR